MSIPKGVRFTRDGVEYLDNVDRANYLIRELTRAALKDTGKFIVKEVKKRIKKRTGTLAKNTQYWVRKKTANKPEYLVVGFKKKGFYGMYQEFGTRKQPKQAIIFKTVSENRETIRRMQAQYLSALNNEEYAISIINESEGE